METPCGCWTRIKVSGSFDLTNIWQVGCGDDVGKVSGGVYSAAGYKYVIPQIRSVILCPFLHISPPH